MLVVDAGKTRYYCVLLALGNLKFAVFYSTPVVLLVLIGKIALGVRFRWRPFVLVWGPCYGVMAQMDVVSIFRQQLRVLACVTFWCTLFAVIDIFFALFDFWAF